MQSAEYRDLVDRIDGIRGVFQSIAMKFPEDTTIAGYRDKLEYALGEARKKRAKRQINLQQYIAAARDVLRMAIERKEDLISASLTKKELDQLIVRIKRAGFVIRDKRILIHAGHLNWGTIIVAERAPAGGRFHSLRRLFVRQLRRP